MLDYNFSVNHLVSILTICACLLYAFQIASIKKVKTVEAKYFTSFILILAFIDFLFLVIDLKLTVKYLNLTLVFFILTFVLLVSPLMWLYIKKLISYEDKTKDIIHFLPSIIISSITFILVVSYLIFNNQIFKTALSGLVYIALILMFILQNIYYVYKSINGYLKHKQKIEEIYSYSEEVDVSWVRILIIGYVTFISAIIITNYFDGPISNVFFNLIILTYIVYIGHNAMKQNSISTSDLKNGIVETEDNKDKQFTEAQIKVFEKIKEDLLEVMKAEKPYLDHNLNIFTLAKRLNTNSKYLSQVINQEFNKSFVHFINEYRVEEAKQILLANNNYTIEAQSQMVGFKSKSSFNIAFKRHTGLTPSLYIQGNS
jgi:AraC-like DNA-binding protein